MAQRGALGGREVVREGDGRVEGKWRLSDSGSGSLDEEPNEGEGQEKEEEEERQMRGR